MPSETSRIYQLLMEALSEQARVIYSIEVDGEPATGDTFPETYNEINVVSMSHDELTMKLSIQSLNQLSQTGKTIDAYMKNILTLPWSEVFKRMSEFIDKIQPFAELLDSISPYVDAYSPPWGKDLKKIAEDQAESLEKYYNHSSKEIQPFFQMNWLMVLFRYLTGQIKFLRIK